MANTLKIKRGAAASIPQGQLAEPLFTTDTYDLYIGKGSGGNQRIQNYIASGTSSQFLKGDGTLDSTSYQPLITAGTTLQYYRGDKTFQTLDTSVVPENGPIYFTEPRVRATVLTGLNLSGGGTIAATDSILTAFGKVQNQISALVGGATYQGTWNASTNTPTLASGTGTKGYYYVVSVAGSTNLDGITDWKIGDWAIFNGTTWDKVDNTDAVSSVNGFTGAVNLALDNISDVSAASPTNAQLLRFNGTSSLWENWTPTFEPALTKGNLTEATSSVLTITGGTGAVIGSGTTIQVASAGAAQNGVVTTGTQTFAGAKTFNSTVTASALYVNGMTAGNGAIYHTGSRLTFANYNASGTLNFEVNGGASAMTINADKTIQMDYYTTNGFVKFSSSNGTLTVDTNTYLTTSSASSTYVPYSGATQTVNLGANGLTAEGITVSKGIAGPKGIFFEQQGTNTSIAGTGYSGIAPISTDGFAFSFNNGTTSYFVLKNNLLSAIRTFSLPDASGTIALTSNLSAYLPLTGGTLTGALSGTSATFSGNLTTNGFAYISPASGNAILQITRTTTTNGAGLSLYTNATQNWLIGTAWGETSSNFVLYNSGTGTQSLKIDYSTNAATFSSSVTATTQGLNSGFNTGAFIAKSNGNNFRYTQVGYDNSGNYGWIQALEQGTAYTNLILNGAGGNVGIGTTSPGSPLTVVNRTDDFSATARLYSTENPASVARHPSIIIGWGIANVDRYIRLGTGPDTGFGTPFNNVNYLTSTGKDFIIGTGADAATLAERMRITSGGELYIDAIGTSGADLKDGAFLYRNNSGSYLQVSSGTNSNFTLFYFYRKNAGNTNVDVVGNIAYVDTSLVLNGGSNSNQVVLTSGGAVGIGNTNPQAKLDLGGTIGGNYKNSFFFYNDNNGGAYHGTKNGFYMDQFSLSNNTTLSFSTASGAPGTFYICSKDTSINTSASLTPRMVIMGQSGEVLIGTTTDSGAYLLQVNGSVYATAYYESSDIRLKDVLTNSYSENFSAIEFMWKDKRDEKKHWGYAAQDVMKYIPDAIEVNNDGMMTVNYNEAHTWKIAQLEAKIVELEAKLK